jgi:hypothetical protein
MNDDAEYEEMRSHYRKIKEQIAPGWAVGQSNQQSELEKEIPGLQKELVEFCLASGRDLEVLNQFFRDVDWETTAGTPG